MQSSYCCTFVLFITGLASGRAVFQITSHYIYFEGAGATLDFNGYHMRVLAQRWTSSGPTRSLPFTGQKPTAWTVHTQEAQPRVVGYLCFVCVPSNSLNDSAEFWFPAGEQASQPASGSGSFE